MEQESVAAAIKVDITDGPSVEVAWTQGMNARDALERAYDAVGSVAAFGFSLQYFGRELGYLVCMINDTYDTFQAASTPFYYWELLVNDEPASQGIEATLLKPGDVIGFRLVSFDPETYQGDLLRARHARRGGPAQG